MEPLHFLNKETEAQRGSHFLSEIAEKVCQSLQEYRPFGCQGAICRNLERNRTKRSKSMFTVD